ncbi:unnamed protein product, partial [Prorocentrum cordatum]
VIAPARGESPSADSDGKCKMQVRLPQWHARLTIDAQQTETTSFTKGDLYIYKCTAEAPRGLRLSDADQACFLTWLIAFTSDYPRPDEIMASPPKTFEWVYIAPSDKGNLIRVLVYIEASEIWGEAFPPDYEALAGQKMRATIGDLKGIVCARFKGMVVNDFDLLASPGEVDVRYCHGSDELKLLSD